MTYYKCDDCNKKFTVRPFINKKHNKIYCPKCNSIYNHVISNKEFFESLIIKE